MAHKIVWPGLIILAHHPREDWSDLANPRGMYPHFMPFHPEMDTTCYLGDINTTKDMYKNGGLIVLIYGGSYGFESLMMAVKNGNLWSKNPWPIILTESRVWGLPRCKPRDEDESLATDVTKEFVVASRERILEHCVQLLLPQHPHLKTHLIVPVMDGQDQPPDAPLPA